MVDGSSTTELTGKSYKGVSNLFQREHVNLSDRTFEIELMGQNFPVTKNDTGDLLVGYPYPQGEIRDIQGNKRDELLAFIPGNKDTNLSPSSIYIPGSLMNQDRAQHFGDIKISGNVGELTVDGKKLASIINLQLVDEHNENIGICQKVPGNIGILPNGGYTQTAKEQIMKALLGAYAAAWVQHNVLNQSHIQ